MYSSLAYNWGQSLFVEQFLESCKIRAWPNLIKVLFIKQKVLRGRLYIILYYIYIIYILYYILYLYTLYYIIIVHKYGIVKQMLIIIESFSSIKSVILTKGLYMFLKAFLYYIQHNFIELIKFLICKFNIQGQKTYLNYILH